MTWLLWSELSPVFYPRAGHQNWPLLSEERPHLFLSLESSFVHDELGKNGLAWP